MSNLSLQKVLVPPAPPEPNPLKEKFMSQNKSAAAQILLRAQNSLKNSYPTEDSECTVTLSIQEIEVNE